MRFFIRAVRINIKIRPLQQLFYSTELIANCATTQVKMAKITDMRVWGDYVFLDVEELPAPMSLRQPVRYRGMRLAGSERFCHLVDVNWHTGEVSVYDDDDDAFARTPSLCLSLRPAAPALPSRVYAAETAMFVARGHSMTDPACRCCHGLSDERAHQLGVTPNSSRPGRCELKRQTSVKVFTAYPKVYQRVS